MRFKLGHKRTFFYDFDAVKKNRKKDVCKRIITRILIAFKNIRVKKKNRRVSMQKNKDMTPCLVSS